MTEGRRRALVVLAVMLPTTLAGLGSFTASAALEQIGGAFGAGPEEITWALTAHIVAYSVTLPVAPWLADLIGEKRLFLMGIAILIGSSALAGAATSLGVMVTARVAQGIAAGTLVPIAQTILMRTFSERSRSRALALWSLGVAAGSIAGPFVGGIVTESWGWPWIFHLNVPIGAAALVLARALLDDPPPPARPARLDLGGVALLAVTVGALQVVLETGEREDWFASGSICAWAAVAVAALVAFVWRELRVANPFMTLAVFKDGNFTIGCLLMAAVGCCQSATVIVSSLHAERLLGYGPFVAGLIMAPAGVATALAVILAGLLDARVPPRLLAVTGAGLAALGMYHLGGLPLEAPLPQLLWPRLEVGLGFGLLLVALATLTLGRLNRREAHQAAGVFNLLRNVGASAGIASLRSVLDRGAQVHQARLLERADLSAPLALARTRGLAAVLLARGSDPTTAERQAWSAVYAAVRRQALHLSFLDGYRILAVVLAAVVPLTLLMRRSLLTQPMELA
jgi:DHA2 family multidrug resistance protein